MPRLSISPRMSRMLSGASRGGISRRLRARRLGDHEPAASMRVLVMRVDQLWVTDERSCVSPDLPSPLLPVSLFPPFWVRDEYCVAGTLQISPMLPRNSRDQHDKTMCLRTSRSTEEVHHSGASNKSSIGVRSSPSRQSSARSS